MTRRDDRIHAEACALWRQVPGEPPPADLDADTALDLLLRAQPPAGYERLATPHLRAANIAFPRNP